MSKPLPLTNGSTLLIFFGTLWIISGCIPIWGLDIPTFLFPSAICTILLFTIRAGFNKRLDENQYTNFSITPSQTKAFYLINFVQWIAIFTAISMVIYYQTPEWIVPSILFIVGLHFLALTPIFGLKIFYFTGSILMLLALFSDQLLGIGLESYQSSILAGVVLYITAILLLYPLKTNRAQD